MSRSVGLAPGNPLSVSIQPFGLGVCGMACAGAAIYLAMQHPWTASAVLLSICMVLWATWRPKDLWFLLPALLPLASFTPWTGWWLLDESDLMVLAAAGGAYLRWSFNTLKTPDSVRSGARWTWWLCVLVLSLLLIGVWRGLDDARAGEAWQALFVGLWQFGVYGDYDLPGNTLRVSKSLLWCLVLVPVLYRWSNDAPRSLARGVVSGLALVSIVVLWERAAYAGVFDFTEQYRITAWFWEMHVGGGAIDMYLALAMPFAWWAVWTAPPGWRWYVAGALLVLGVYVVLVTYSRGVYFVVASALIALAALAQRCRFAAPEHSAWRRRAMAGLAVVVVAEAMGVMLGGSFMSGRLAHANEDAYQRLAHWQRGIGLLETPSEWVLGLGAGRLPAHYARTPHGTMPGRIAWNTNSDGQTTPLLFGPSNGDAKGEIALTHRVSLPSDSGYRVRLQGSVQSPVQLLIRLCAQHLLYAMQCQMRRPFVYPTPVSGESRVEVLLRGPEFSTGGPLTRSRGGVLSIAVLGPEPLHLASVELIDAHGRQLIKNPDFGSGPRYWSTLAQRNFLPWHMDNVFIELLVERGLFGLLMFGALVIGSLILCVRGAVQERKPLALVLGIAIGSALLIGVVVSTIEIPRVSLMLWLSLVVSPLVVADLRQARTWVQ